MVDPSETIYQRDLYCLSCGYNLRGLSGDPVRCPECGNDNPLEAILTPAATIAGQLRRLETAPTLCVAAVVCLLSGGLFVLGLLSDPKHPPMHVMGAMGAGLIVLCPVLWRIGAKRFAASCLHDPAWQPALNRFVMLSLLAFPAVYGVCFLAIALPIGFVSDSGVSNSFILLMSGVLLLPALLLASRVAKFIHRRTTAIIIPLQRKVAVRLANEESPYQPPRSDIEGSLCADDE